MPPAHYPTFSPLTVPVKGALSLEKPLAGGPGFGDCLPIPEQMGAPPLRLLQGWGTYRSVIGMKIETLTAWATRLAGDRRELVVDVRCQ